MKGIDFTYIFSTPDVTFYLILSAITPVLNNDEMAYATRGKNCARGTPGQASTHVTCTATDCTASATATGGGGGEGSDGGSPSGVRGVPGGTGGPATTSTSTGGGCGVCGGDPGGGNGVRHGTGGPP
jgi:hypothetical protein